jgi:hypothetical protein
MAMRRDDANSLAQSVKAIRIGLYNGYCDPK